MSICKFFIAELKSVSIALRALVKYLLLSFAVLIIFRVLTLAMLLTPVQGSRHCRITGMLSRSTGISKLINLTEAMRHTLRGSYYALNLSKSVPLLDTYRRMCRGRRHPLSPQIAAPASPPHLPFSLFCSLLVVMKAALLNL